MLEKVSGKSAEQYRQADGQAAEAVQSLKPIAYWRMDEMAGSVVVDQTGNGRHGTYEQPVAYFLEGPAQFDVGEDEALLTEE